MPSQPAWAQPRNVALLIAGYLLVHMGVRKAASLNVVFAALTRGSRDLGN